MKWYRIKDYLKIVAIVLGGYITAGALVVGAFWLKDHLLFICR